MFNFIVDMATLFFFGGVGGGGGGLDAVYNYPVN